MEGAQMLSNLLFQTWWTLPTRAHILQQRPRHEGLRYFSFSGPGAKPECHVRRSGISFTKLRALGHRHEDGSLSHSTLQSKSAWIRPKSVKSFQFVHVYSTSKSIIPPRFLYSVDRNTRFVRHIRRVPHPFPLHHLGMNLEKDRVTDSPGLSSYIFHRVGVPEAEMQVPVHVAQTASWLHSFPPGAGTSTPLSLSVAIGKSPPISRMS